MYRSLFKKLFFLSFAFMAAIFFRSGTVDAATLSLLPSNGHVSVGNIITVSVVLNTQGQAANTSDAIIQFPADLLQVVSVSKSNSVFSLWVEDPTYSNSNGTVSFDGGVPNPGYTGSNGTVVSMTFLAKKAGTASLLISDSSVRANDGLGTDILSAKNGATIAIAAASANTAPAVTPTTPVTPPQNTLALPALVVTSSTHPRQDMWYNISNIDLAWNLPSNAISTKTFLGAHADSEPSVVYKPAISSKTISNLEDGVWYFDVNYSTSAGTSPTTHYRLQIDTASPQNLAFSATKADFGGANVTLRADDALSGIDHYTVAVDDSNTYIFKPDEAGNVTGYVPISAAGDHVLSASAYDKAGNVSKTTASITTDVASQVTIDTYPSRIKVGEAITVTGSAPYTDAPLVLSVQKSDGSIEKYNLVSDAGARYEVTTRAITDAGTYRLHVDLLRSDGTPLLPSRSVTTIVKNPVLVQIGAFTVSLLSVLIPTLALLFVLLFLIYYGWHKFFRLRKYMRADMEKIEDRVHHSLGLLSDEVSKQLGAVEGAGKFRKGSAEEKRAISDLKAAISDIDVYIGREIKKIEGVSPKKKRVSKKIAPKE